MTAAIKALMGRVGKGASGSSSGSKANKSTTDKMDISIKLSEDPSFDMLVLGCGGGPAENDLSAYWVKPAGQAWSEGFVSVDGGSCLGALIRLLASHPAALSDFLDHPPSLPQQQGGPSISAAARAAMSSSTLLQAGQIYDMLQAFLITHAHWDHISGLVLSSSSGSSKQKEVYGSKQTISNLSSAMNGGLWPVLGSYEASKSVPYIWRDMDFSKSVKPSKGLSASIMPLSHGIHHQGTSYESSAFFLENNATGKSILIFGDVEPDSVSGLSLNKDIWIESAKRMSAGRLNAMLIECSYCSSRPKEQLYGHLTPMYIAEELLVLASLIPPLPGRDAADLKGRLKGVTVGIIHVKDPTSLAEVLAFSEGSAQNTAGAASPTGNKRPKVSPSLSASAPASAQSPPSRRTRSASSRSALQQSDTKAGIKTREAQGINLHLPEQIKNKIYSELQELESRDQLGVRYLMLEQGMRIAI
ncbi:hypothetical protein P389DRAFT_165570 [Cystobasidium minutum MCA 4210]|uniref:uncharacterized protein n=1 Tax=Cystobasidium minutum MCA 4210 TaxID=1397322 RepID=UPI0034CDE527|eukprot:jgi/Rhomi1/165570/fgenesh1_kg.1_\